MTDKIYIGTQQYNTEETRVVNYYSRPHISVVPFNYVPAALLIASPHAINIIQQFPLPKNVFMQYGFFYDGGN